MRPVASADVIGAGGRDDEALVFRRSRLRNLGLFAALIAAAGATALIGLATGAVRIPVSEVGSLLIERLRMGEDAAGLGTVLWELRLPRVVLGLLAGSCLAVCGALMQGLFRNPLADPGLIGVSSGAALGAVFSIVLGAKLFPGQPWLADPRFLPISAFAGAFLVSEIIQRVGTRDHITSVGLLLLAGVAINSLVGALVGLSTFLATDDQLRSLSFWTLGSLGAASWKTLGSLLPFVLLTLFIGPRMARTLNALSLGEAQARYLGFDVEREKRHIALVTTAGVGACVAATGMIGFIGLVVPHLIRLWIGPDHRTLIPASALLGAIVLTGADTAARTVAAPAEVPIGILTAAGGAPFFLWLLLRQRRLVLPS